MAAQTGYQLKLTGPGLELEKEVSEDLANRITLLVLSGGKSEQQPPPGGGGAPANPPGTANTVGNKSVREYLSASGAVKIPQQMTAIGNYILEKQKKEKFSLEELLRGFSDAKETPPGNPHRDIGDAIKRGWIAGDKNGYYITSTGAAAIDNRFPKELRKRNKKRPAAAKK